MRTRVGDVMTIEGEIRISGESRPNDVLALLASRFVIEARGRLRSAIARPANAVGMSMLEGGIEAEPHAHREAQLLYLVRGELTCHASNALFIVPPQSALWIPGAAMHAIHARAPLEGYSLFVEPDAAPNLPRDACAVSVSPLFRELLLRAATRPALYELDGPDGRLMRVLIDELAAAAIENHRLPMPTDERLCRLVEAMRKRPSDPATAKMWAKRIGMSERTLHRVLVRETGLGFGRWRQQLHIILALQQLSRGASVQRVAAELGYESASFVTMFKKALGTSPARYMARRLASGQPS